MPGRRAGRANGCWPGQAGSLQRVAPHVHGSASSMAAHPTHELGEAPPLATHSRCRTPRVPPHPLPARLQQHWGPGCERHRVAHAAQRHGRQRSCHVGGRGGQEGGPPLQKLLRRLPPKQHFQLRWWWWWWGGAGAQGGGPERWVGRRAWEGGGLAGAHWQHEKGQPLYGRSAHFSTRAFSAPRPARAMSGPQGPPISHKGGRAQTGHGWHALQPRAWRVAPAARSTHALQGRRTPTWLAPAAAHSRRGRGAAGVAERAAAARRCRPRAALLPRRPCPSAPAGRGKGTGTHRTARLMQAHMWLTQAQLRRGPQPAQLGGPAA